MIFTLFVPEQSEEVATLFYTTFSDAEGVTEGKLIRKLVYDLVSTNYESDVIGFVAVDEAAVVGAVFFSRLLLSNERSAFLLSPMAIATEYQGKGYGQKLIAKGIEHLKILGVDCIVTYGDPKFYNKAGFSPLNAKLLIPPYTLSQPEGWLARWLKAQPITLSSQVDCVPAFKDPIYW